jgi:DNA repair exonuclease SbcCD ATPase subunit
MEVTRSPELIAAEINHLKHQTKAMVLYNSIEIGRRLVEAKQCVAHGEWGKWLETSVDYSPRTAQNLMRIFDEYGADQVALFEGNAKSQALASLSYTQAVALLGVPSEEREAFIEENDVESMSTRELQAVIKERDEARKKLEDSRQRLKEAGEQVGKLREEKLKAESTLRTTDEVLRKTQEEVKVVQEWRRKDKEKSEKNIEELQTIITETKKQLSEAQASGDNEEANRLTESLDKTDAELVAAQERIKELERQLIEKPIEVSATVERVPEEIERELEELRKSQKSAAAVKFSVRFEELVNGFKALLGTLDDMDTEERERYKKAVSGLIGKMTERL